MITHIAGVVMLLGYFIMDSALLLPQYQQDGMEIKLEYINVEQIVSNALPPMIVNYVLQVIIGIPMIQIVTLNSHSQVVIVYPIVCNAIQKQNVMYAGVLMF